MRVTVVANAENPETLTGEGTLVAETPFHDGEKTSAVVDLDSGERVWVPLDQVRKHRDAEGRWV